MFETVYFKSVYTVQDTPVPVLFTLSCSSPSRSCASRFADPNFTVLIVSSLSPSEPGIQTVLKRRHVVLPSFSIIRKGLLVCANSVSLSRTCFLGHILSASSKVALAQRAFILQQIISSEGLTIAVCGSVKFEPEMQVHTRSKDKIWIC